LDVVPVEEHSLQGHIGRDEAERADRAVEDGARHG
jgi:hypothetical protein